MTHLRHPKRPELDPLNGRHRHNLPNRAATWVLPRRHLAFCHTAVALSLFAEPRRWAIRTPAAGPRTLSPVAEPSDRGVSVPVGAPLRMIAGVVTTPVTLNERRAERYWAVSADRAGRTDAEKFIGGKKLRIRSMTKTGESPSPLATERRWTGAITGEQEHYATDCGKHKHLLHRSSPIGFRFMLDHGVTDTASRQARNPFHPLQSSDSQTGRRYG